MTELDSTDIYYSMVVTGERTINDVPSRIRNEVIDRLVRNGFLELVDPDGNLKKVKV